MKQIAKEIRRLTVDCIASLGQGHIGGSLSIVDVLTILYYKHMNVDVNNPSMEGRDRLVVSKGHAGPGVYAALLEIKDYAIKSTLSRNDEVNKVIKKKVKKIISFIIVIECLEINPYICS